MSYTVKEIFKTLQGEGQNAGRPAVFLRFAGCNLDCKWCDTDFKGGDKFELDELITKVCSTWDSGNFRGRFVVLTGGEPLLQVDKPLIETLLENHFRIAVETNGTIKVPEHIQHLTVSPKSGTEIKQREASELKFVYPQEGMTPDDALELVNAPINYLQPMDGPDRDENTRAAIDYCLSHPWWRLSLQTHKILGLR